MVKNKAIIEFQLSDELVSLNESCYPKIKGEVLKIAINPFTHTGIITFNCSEVGLCVVDKAIRVLQEIGMED